MSLFVYKKKLILNKFIQELRKIESQLGFSQIKKENNENSDENIQAENTNNMGLQNENILTESLQG